MTRTAPPSTSPSTPAKAPSRTRRSITSDYTKAKTAQEMLTHSAGEGHGGSWTISTVCWTASTRAQGDRDLQEIRQELADDGLPPPAGSKAKDRMKPPGAPSPWSFAPPAACASPVGRNNLQNDRLTTKQAGK